jgi:hypothetical protein
MFPSVTGKLVPRSTWFCNQPANFARACRGMQGGTPAEAAAPQAEGRNIREFRELTRIALDWFQKGTGRKDRGFHGCGKKEDWLSRPKAQKSAKV